MEFFKGYCQGCPGLTQEHVGTNINANAMATVQGLLTEKQQGKWPTKQNSTNHPLGHREDIFQQEQSNVIIHNLLIAIEVAGKLFLDQTGQTAIQFSWGYNYVPLSMCIMLILFYLSLLKNTQKKKCCVCMRISTPRSMPAGTSHACISWTINIEWFITAEQATYQYVPPEMKCTNASEKAVQNGKNYFKAWLTSLPQEIPRAHWC